MPGFAEFFEVAAVAFAGAGRIKTDVFAASDGVHRDDVPGIVGDDVGGEEVDVISGVQTASVAVAANAKIDEVSAAMRGESGFDLDAEQAVSAGDHEIESQAVAVRLADAESEAGGFEDENQFGEFAFALGTAGLASGFGTADGTRVGKVTLPHN
jgi:hypothetical protein